jgi:hypothetical protein
MIGRCQARHMTAPSVTLALIVYTVLTEIHPGKTFSCNFFPCGVKTFF